MIAVAEGILLAIAIVVVAMLILGFIGAQIFVYKASGFTPWQRLWWRIKGDPY